VRWHPSSPGFIKINVDGSLINTSTASIFIIRNWTSKLIQAGAAYYRETSILVAKVRALRDGVSLAVQMGKIVIKGDNNNVIQALRGNIQTSW